MNKIKDRYMKNGVIQVIPRKEKDKIALLACLVEGFEIGRQYSEQEVNIILQQYYDDFAILRRYLVDYQFLRRDLEGKTYELHPIDCDKEGPAVE